MDSCENVSLQTTISRIIWEILWISEIFKLRHSRNSSLFYPTHMFNNKSFCYQYFFVILHYFFFYCTLLLSYLFFIYFKINLIGKKSWKFSLFIKFSCSGALKHFGPLSLLYFKALILALQARGNMAMWQWLNRF